jgi:hypothetical protein
VERDYQLELDCAILEDDHSQVPYKIVCDGGNVIEAVHHCVRQRCQQGGGSDVEDRRRRTVGSKIVRSGMGGNLVPEGTELLKRLPDLV